MTENIGTDAAFEQRLAQLSEEQFDAVVARTRPHTPPPQTALERARIEGRAKAGRLVELRAESDARNSDLARGCLGPTRSDQAAAAQAAQEAAWHAAQTQAAPQGFTPNRGQAASGTPPPPAPETGQQKAGQLHDLHRQQRQIGS